MEALLKLLDRLHTLPYYRQRNVSNSSHLVTTHVSGDTVVGKCIAQTNTQNGCGFVQARIGVFITAIKTVTLASSSHVRPFSPEKIANTHYPSCLPSEAHHVVTLSIWGVRRTTGEEHTDKKSTAITNTVSPTTALKRMKHSLKTPPRHC